MAASASGQAPQASLLSLLTALSIHLTPFPLLYALPSALQLFAHFQLVSERIKAEAARALREDEKLRTTSSALNEKERRRVERWAGRDAVDAMLGFSVEFRKHHIAILLSTPKVPPARISSLIDVYFPDLNDGQAPEATSLLFIRMMSQDQLLMLRPYRQVVLGWYETALAAHSEGLRCPSLSELTGKDRADQLEVLARNLIREAEHVIRDAEEMEAMFKPVEADEEEGTTAEVIRDILPVTDILMVNEEADVAVIEPPPSKASKSERRHTLTAPLVTMHASQVIRSRASLPPAAPAQQYDSSPSPSPERIARLPRVSFDLSKNRRRARISVEPRNPTTSSVRRHHEVDMDEEMPELPLPLPLPSSRATSPESGLADPQIGKSSKAPVGRSSSAHNRVAGLTSAIPKRTRSPMTPVKASKVRPRNSSGLPPPSGPDYTAPVPTLGANVDKAQLRPFDNSRLKRPRTSTTRDENSPRAEKRVREDKREGLGGESQENSQESYHGVITRRVEKRKVR